MTTLKEAAAMALDALDIGHDCAIECANRVHTEYAGYKPHRHAAADKDVAQIQAAITALRAALSAPAATGGSPEHLLQDQSRELSRWLADKPDARLRVRERCAAIAAAQPAPDVDPLLRAMIDDGLIAAPVQPLTDARIGELFADHDECKTYRDGIGFARAVLAAAGIPAPTTDTGEQQR